MNKEMYLELQNVDLNNEEALTKAALQIKELSKDAEGVFELTSLHQDAWKAAAVIYPVYTKYETSVNKKAGYPDIMAQMRALKARAYAEFSFKQAVDYLNVLIGTIEVISPEIYENYRELVEDFRQTMGKAIEDFALVADKPLAGQTDQMVCKELATVMERAFAEKVLLKEKYQELAIALRG
ncbi:MAG: hypothetical protein IJW63_05775 [Lachnospiraceae bacterium]|nr:hypothetical protein [Lachnospiraceae bacterium]